jgi:hypothetical protein
MKGRQYLDEARRVHRQLEYKFLLDLSRLLLHRMVSENV